MVAEDRFRRDGASESPTGSIDTIYESIGSIVGHHLLLGNGLKIHKNGFTDLPQKGEKVYLILSVKDGRLPYLIDWVRGNVI